MGSRETAYLLIIYKLKNGFLHRCKAAVKSVFER
jgi:hypothetical protein